jgi:hypothetical protein
LPSEEEGRAFWIIYQSFIFVNVWSGWRELGLVSGCCFFSVGSWRRGLTYVFLVTPGLFLILFFLHRIDGSAILRIADSLTLTNLA